MDVFTLSDRRTCNYMIGASPCGSRAVLMARSQNGAPMFRCLQHSSEWAPITVTGVWPADSSAFTTEASGQEFYASGLPDGLNLAVGGVIHGTPTSSGVFTLKVSDDRELVRELEVELEAAEELIQQIRDRAQDFERAISEMRGVNNGLRNTLEAIG